MIPAADEMPQDVYEAALGQALSDAAARGVRGRDVTPFLLERLRSLEDSRAAGVGERQRQLQHVAADDDVVRVDAGPGIVAEVRQRHARRGRPAQHLPRDV